MPELPEVEVVRRGLETHATGRAVTAVEVLHHRPVRRDPGGAAGFQASLTGRTLGLARRRGKYLWVPLDDGDALVAHLGMSGQFLVQPPSAADERHLRVRIELDDGHELRFVDQRMFGGLATSPGGAELPPEIAHIARDLLDQEFDLNDFVARVQRRKSGIKRLLLDQKLVSGVGNIYADEALWRARLHGERPGERLSVPKIRELAQHAREVMESALDQGGTSFDALYVNVNGESGISHEGSNVEGFEARSYKRRGTPILREWFINRSSRVLPGIPVKTLVSAGLIPGTCNSYVSEYDVLRLPVRQCVPLRHAVPTSQAGRAAGMTARYAAEYRPGAGVRTPRGAANA